MSPPSDARTPNRLIQVLTQGEDHSICQSFSLQNRKGRSD